VISFDLYLSIRISSKREGYRKEMGRKWKENRKKIERK